MPDAPGPSLLQTLRRHLAGVVVADPLAVRVRYILDPRTGDPIVACRPDTGETDDWVLFVPDESEGALHLAGRAEPLDPDRDGVCDRWRAYHGTSGSGRFFRLRVQWVRCGGVVWDAEEVRAVNRVVGVEGRLLRSLNAEPGRVRALAARAAGVVVPEAVAVGVDEGGIDVRAWHQVVRVGFAVEAASEEAATAAVEELLREVAP